MDGSNIGWIGGVGGSVVGIAGGIFGTWCSIYNAKTPDEKSLIVGYSIACWALVTLFLVALFLTPMPYNWLWWIPFALAFTYGINRLKHDQKHMRILSGLAFRR
jgi:hypothetical protein